MADRYLLPILTLSAYLVIAVEPTSAGEIFIGFTAQQSTLFIADEDTQSDLAEMESNLYYSPTLSVRSENNYFRDNSNWGYFLEFNTGFYIVNRQVVNGNTVNLNTSLSGQYWDLTPTIFYNFGGKKQENWAFKTGLGVGVGYLSVSGNAVLTEQAGQPLVSYDDDGYGFTVGVFLEAIKNDWFLQIKTYGPDLVIGDTDLFLVNFKMTFGKMFKF
jgi:hypothetical protein